MEWCDYYERMFEWAESTRVRRMSDLTEFGDSEEVFDATLNFDEEKNASKFVLKALSAGVRFSPEQTVDLILNIDKTALSRVAESAGGVFTRAQLDELYLSIEEESFQRISRKAGINIFADDEPVIRKRSEASQTLKRTYGNTTQKHGISGSYTSSQPRTKKPTLKTWMRLFKSMGSLGRALNPTNFMPLTYKEKRRSAQAKARRNRPWWDK